MLSYNNKSINESVKEYAELCIAQSYFSDTLVNFHVDVEKGNIVIPFSNLSLPDVEKYLTDMGNNLIKRQFGYIDDADKTFYRDSFPFGLSEGELVCDENDEPKELIVPITPEVALNLNRLIISEVHRYVQSQVFVNLKKKGKSREEALKTLEQMHLVPVDKSLPYECHVHINDRSLITDYTEAFEHLMYSNCGQDSSLKFYRLSGGGELFFTNMNNSTFIDGVKKAMINGIARDFRTPGAIESKIENLKNAIAGFIYESTGKVVCGFDIIKYTENDSDFFLVPLVKLDGQTRFLSSEDKIRFNEECRRNGLGGNVLADTYIKDVGNRPVLFPKGIIPLLPKIMKSPIGYNEKSERFEYAVNLGNFYKSRTHSDLNEDLRCILMNRFVDKDGYLDEPGLSKASKYIWQCLSESGFGLNGYYHEELEELVKEKIKEWRIVEKQSSQNKVILRRQVVNVRPVSLHVPPPYKRRGSIGSVSGYSSGGSSQPVSPLFGPRNISDCSLSSQGSSGFSAFPSGASSVSDLTQAPSTPFAHHNPTMPPLGEEPGESEPGISFNPKHSSSFGKELHDTKKVVSPSSNMSSTDVKEVASQSQNENNTQKKRDRCTIL